MREVQGVAGRLKGEVAHALLLRPGKDHAGVGTELFCGDHGAEAVEVGIDVGGYYVHKVSPEFRCPAMLSDFFDPSAIFPTSPIMLFQNYVQTPLNQKVVTMKLLHVAQYVTWQAWSVHSGSRTS